MPGKWVIGGLISNLWGISEDPGGGVGKIFKIGSQAMNAQVAYYHNLEKPDITGDWSIRLQLQFMFPK